MADLTLDAFFKKKILSGGEKNQKKILDKRRFKKKLTPNEIIDNSIMKVILSFGFDDPDRVLKIVKSVPNYTRLNIALLLVVYNYFSTKNFNFLLVAENFDDDFKKQLVFINEKKYFTELNLNDKLKVYKFRQDFIIYMMLINESEISEDEFSQIEYKTVEIVDPERENLLRMTEDDY